MTLNEAFAARVKELLKEKKITQYKLGQRTGLYPSTVNYICMQRQKRLTSKLWLL